MTEPVLELLEQEWSVIDELCSELSAKEWKLPTDCPGWTVKDQLSHICGLEARFLGQNEPAPLENAPEHVKNPVGAVNEASIERRRPLPPEEILAEFLELTTARLKVLADAPDWGATAKGLLGEAPLRDVIAIRLVDCFYHEQDIRRATGRAGHLNGDVARFVLGRMKATTPMIVGKRAQAPDGATVVFDVDDDAWAVTVSGGRGAIADAKGAKADATLRCDAEAFLCLTGGRWTAQQAIEMGRLTLTGDLARRVAETANIMV